MNNATTESAIKDIIQNAPCAYDCRNVLRLCAASLVNRLDDIQEELNRYNPDFLKLAKMVDLLRSDAHHLHHATRLASAMADLQDLTKEPANVTPTGAPLHPSDDDTPFPS